MNFSPFKRGIALAACGFLGLALISGALYAQQVTFVQILIGGAPVASGNPLPVSIGGSVGAVLTKSGTYVSSGTDQFALAVATNTQLTVPVGTTCAQITVEGASIRRTSDATGATTTNGTLIPAGASWQDCGPLAAYKFTAVSGSPTLDVEYFK